MKMYPIKIPGWLQSMMPAYTWRLPTSDKTLFLTFDDGPIPEVTPWVLDTLRAYGARATFFCVGDNVRKHPQIFERLLAEGHAVGNHTFNHLNGWKTPDSVYLDNIEQCEKLVPGRLFRPPYGRLKPSQRKKITEHYRIIMWDILSGDFDVKTTPAQCLEQVVNSAGPGSIIVMHDSLKAAPNLRPVLPALLEHFTRLGFSFKSIDI
jgi:peptidoglycan/xylan/chitin deacetylase (PgdA/CDA1 family)